MTELAEIAQAVARALELEEDGNHAGWRRLTTPNRQDHLRLDGYNVFSDPWFRLALEWLLEHRYTLTFEPGDISHDCYQRSRIVKQGPILNCPAAEFPARCIHALEREER
jgi:hypothetical protein